MGMACLDVHASAVEGVSLGLCLAGQPGHTLQPLCPLRLPLQFRQRLITGYLSRRPLILLILCC